MYTTQKRFYMNAIQLEFDIESRTPEEREFYYMRKEIAAMNESMGKVRRKLFAEIGEMKKACNALHLENEALKAQLREMQNSPTSWEYCKGDRLFDTQS